MPFDPSVAYLEDTDLLGMTATTAEVGIMIAPAVLLDGASRRIAINALLPREYFSLGAQARGDPPVSQASTAADKGARK